MAEKVKKELGRQQLLPQLQTKEVLASITYLMLARDGDIKYDGERGHAHVTNLLEYAVREGVIGEGDITSPI